VNPAIARRGQRIRQPVERLGDALDRKTDLGLHELTRHEKVGGMTLRKLIDAHPHDPAGQRMDLGQISVMMVEAEVLGSRQTAGVVGRHDASMETARHLHDAGIDIPDIGDPEIDRGVRTLLQAKASPQRSSWRMTFSQSPSGPVPVRCRASKTS
jgi:hypothetical protein